jgi:putative membrane protein
MKKILLAFMTAGLFIVGCDKDDNDDNMDNSMVLNSTDRNFISKAYMTNTAAIELGQLAANSDNDSIVAYGQMMVTDHSAAKNQLRTLADSLTVTVSDSLDAENTALKAQLQGLTGRQFDSVYINSQSTLSQNAITLFNDELSNGQHVRVKSYASGLLPTIQGHKTMADSLVVTFQ